VGDEVCVDGIIAPDTLNLRAGPSTDWPVLLELNPTHCRITVLGPTVDGWLPVQLTHFGGDTSGLYVGYVFSTYVRTTQRADPLGPFNPNLFDPSWCVVGTASLPLRISPTETPSQLDLLPPLPAGQCYLYPTLTDATGQWTLVASSETSTAGWVAATALVTTERFVDFGPNPQMRTVSFNLIGQDGRPSPPASNFRAVIADRPGYPGLTVGMLRADATLELPVDFDPTQLRFVGHPVGDKWCLVEGDVSSSSTSDGSYLITTRPGLCV
jgi:hypothetical protein